MAHYEDIYEYPSSLDGQGLRIGIVMSLRCRKFGSGKGTCR